MGALTIEPHEVDALAGHFSAVVDRVPLRRIMNAAEYDQAVRAMDGLMDAGAGDENHPLAALLAALGHFISDYDERFHRLDPAMPGTA